MKEKYEAEINTSNLVAKGMYYWTSHLTNNIVVSVNDTNQL